MSFLILLRSLLIIWLISVSAWVLAEPSLVVTPPVTDLPAEEEEEKPESSIPEITNWDDILTQLKVKSFNGSQFTRKLKIAILDNGFAGYESQIGVSLPKDTFYDAGGSEGAATALESFHGLFMANLVAGIIAKSGATADYELHLLNSYGYTRFKNQVNKVIQEKFDLVLYSQVWEYGGNGDGKGFINALVNQATDAGVIWINASGNFDYLTHVAAIKGKVEGTDEYVDFTDEKKKAIEGVKIFCKIKEGEQCTLRLVLAWNDFKDDAETGTDKDLDFYLINDANKKVVGFSERRQMLMADLSNPQSSIVPRELIETKLEPGAYTARVKISSKNFSAETDRLRVTATGYGIEMGNASIGETLLPPADNPTAIVIGASDDFQSSKSKSLKLPEVHFKSVVKLKDGSGPFSSSIAAAMAAGVAALHLGIDTEKSRSAVLAQLKLVSVDAEDPKKKAKEKGPAQEKSIPQPRSASKAKKTRVQPDGFDKCIQRVRPTRLYPALRDVLSSKQAVLGDFNGLAVVFVTAKFADQKRLRNNARMKNSIFVVTPQGIKVMSRSKARIPPQDVYPILIMKRNLPLCKRAKQGPRPQTQDVKAVRVPALYPAARAFLEQGGAIPVHSRGRVAFVVNLEFAAHVGVLYEPGQPDFGRFVLTPNGLQFVDLNQLANLPIEFYEIIPRP